MARHQIATKIHLFDEFNHKLTWPVTKSATHYVVDDEILNLMNESGSSLQKAYKEYQDAGLFFLPRPEIVVEFTSSKVNWIVFLKQTPISGEIVANVAMYFAPGYLRDDSKIRTDGNKIVNDRPVIGQHKAPFRFTRDGKIYHGDYKTIDIEMIGTGAPKEIGLRFYSEKPDNIDLMVLTLAAATSAVMFSGIMVNTRGIEKELIESDKLNKKRQSLGKSAIPSYRYCHIATVYDKEGKGHGNSDGGRGGRKRVHWRRAHVRHQVFGPKRSERKLIEVPGVLINFDPNGPEEQRVEINLPVKVRK